VSGHIADLFNQNEEASVKRPLLSVVFAGMFAGTFTTGAAIAEDNMVIQIKRMSMETATAVAKAAVEACRAKGVQIGVTVVDRDGIPQAVMRDTIAPVITLQISQGKAYAAVMFNVPTSELSARANTPIGRVPGVVMSAGGVPIEVGGSLLGGVGVSGAPSGETDQECAQAGVEAVQTDLEMSM
jgi:uncharacterized protein GlcG (DUF336 family)